MVFNRIFGGAVYALLSLLDLNFGSRPPSFGTFSDSMANMRQSNAVIWRFAESGWMCVPSLIHSPSKRLTENDVSQTTLISVSLSSTQHDRLSKITISRPSPSNLILTLDALILRSTIIYPTRPFRATT